jgi:hypothetical protein
MLRLACLVLLSSSTLVSAQAPKFTFTTGQVLNYRLEQLTTVTETSLEEMTNKPVTGITVTKMEVSRRWEVKSVEAGVASLEMSITAMKQQINRPGANDKNGKPTVDQVVLDSSTPEGQQAMAAFLNKPIVTIKLDQQGKLIDAKSTSGSADRLFAELPFRITFPETMPAVGGNWDRSFKIKLPPPLGVGEEFDAKQTYTLKGENGGHLVFGVSTKLAAEPKSNSELPPLVPMLWEGDIFFHVAAGRYAGSKLSIKREIPNHQGEGSKFVYESNYTEVLSEK